MQLSKFRLSYTCASVRLKSCHLGDLVQHTHTLTHKTTTVTLLRMRGGLIDGRVNQVNLDSTVGQFPGAMQASITFQLDHVQLDQWCFMQLIACMQLYGPNCMSFIQHSLFKNSAV